MRGVSFAATIMAEPGDPPGNPHQMMNWLGLGPSECSSGPHKAQGAVLPGPVEERAARWSRVPGPGAAAPPELPGQIPPGQEIAGVTADGALAPEAPRIIPPRKSPDPKGPTPPGQPPATESCADRNAPVAPPADDGAPAAVEAVQRPGCIASNCRASACPRALRPSDRRFQVRLLSRTASAHSAHRTQRSQDKSEERGGESSHQSFRETELYDPPSTGRCCRSPTREVSPSFPGGFRPRVRPRRCRVG